MKEGVRWTRREQQTRTRKGERSIFQHNTADNRSGPSDGTRLGSAHSSAELADESRSAAYARAMWRLAMYLQDTMGGQERSRAI